MDSRDGWANGCVLVTGGAGYIGAHAVLALLDAGHQIIILDDFSTGSRAFLPRGVEVFEGKAGDTALLKKIFSTHKIDGVLHFAGSIIVPDAIRDPIAYYGNNVVTSHALIAACLEAGIGNFVFSSSAAVYGEVEPIPVGEDVTPQPINPYGWSKYMTERMLQDAYKAYGFRYAILRYFNVAGADPLGRAGQMNPKATQLIARACRTALGFAPPLEIFGEDYPTDDGTCVRDFIHVADLADAHVLALRHLMVGSESFLLNCGYGKGASVKQVIAAVERVTGKSLAIRKAPRRAGDPASVVAQADKIRSMLGWQPRHEDLDEIIASALAWEKLRVNLA